MLAHFLYWLKRPYHFVKTGLLNGLPAQLRYRFPARYLKIIAITGTDGKTTSSTLLYSVLKVAGKKVGLISTVAAYVGDNQVETGLHVTTPEPSEVIKLMRQMVDQGFEYLVLETTSHGLYQYRTWGVKPLIAGLTNIDQEHLDYHLTYDNYVDAKCLLLKQAQVAVINADDESYLKVKRRLRDTTVEMKEYSAQAKLSPVIAKAIKARLPEPYNQMNARLVTMIAKHLEIEDKAIAQGFTEFPGVPGRVERVPNQARLEIVVDFAHTPQALEAVLSSLRLQMKAKKSKGKLIAVFGAAGLRDPIKRPAMGAFAAEIADLVVMTADDPRTENVWAIIDQLKSNITPNHGKVMSMANRQEAINFAIQQLAKPGDVIALCGKGHERSLAYATEEIPWSDVEAAQRALAGLKK
jgi:UDP-N-acetylmuramoyl-L-alanyl-D-glutamate--2,6-diaminopimelate ligase